MSKSALWFKSLSVFIFLLLVNGQQDSSEFRLKTPADFDLRNDLINFIANQPGIDMVAFNNEEVRMVIPRIHLPSFYKLGMLPNGTDLLERTLLDKARVSIDPASNQNSRKVNSAMRRRHDNGVLRLMRTSNKHLISINFNRRPSYGKIVFYLRKLAKRFPTKINLKRIGKTAKGKFIFIVLLFDRQTKYNGVFLHAGAHGHDWSSVMMALYVITELSENSHSYTMLQAFTWYLIPVVNPDAYQLSYKDSQTKWSKNRNCSKTCQVGECGVDILRNFPWNFNGIGSSTRPCSSFYAGPSIFSEIESTILGHALIRNHKHLQLYIGIEGSGSAILYPWGYSYRPCSDDRDLKTLALIAAQAMNVAGQDAVNYTIGNYGSVTCIQATPQHFVFVQASFSDPNAGGPLDYAKRHLHIKYSYVLQMRGVQARLLEETSQVMPAILETFAGIKTMVKYIYNNNVPLKDRLRSNMTKRRRLTRTNMGCRVRIGYVFIICHLITKFVRWLYK